MNIQRKNSAHHFRMQSEREQTLVHVFSESYSIVYSACKISENVSLKQHMMPKILITKGVK